MRTLEFVIDVHIREIVESDLVDILRINQANVPQVGSLDLDSVRFLVGESHVALVFEQIERDGAQQVGTPMGFCLILAPGSSYDSVNYTWFMEQHPGVMYLDRVAFDAAFQGAGHGRALYEHVELLIRSDAPDTPGLGLEVNIDPPNEPSLRFHDKLGFAEVGRQMSHGIEVSLMFKPTHAFANG